MQGVTRAPKSHPTLGYALGGGAVRGAAHLGFLSAFEDAGIRPDLIAGTSAGAIVGAGYCAGVSIAEMSRMIRSVTWREVTSVAWRTRMSIFDTTPLRQWIESATGDVTFDDLQIPLGIVTCNIIDGRKIVLREGSVVRAAVASSAIPGLFSPDPIDEMLLIDGGTVENLPVATAREMGADIVVAVDVSPAFRHAARPESLRDIVTATLTLAAANTQIEARVDADFLLQPDIERFSPWDFASAGAIEEAGRTAALQIVDQVLAATAGRRISRAVTSAPRTRDGR